MRRVIWWLIVGTKGGVNRARIIRALNERPFNANQLSEVLGLDYKTVRHHLKVLLENKIITAAGEGYGSAYFLSPGMEEEYEVFKEDFDLLLLLFHPLYIFGWFFDVFGGFSKYSKEYLDKVWNKYKSAKARK